MKNTLNTTDSCRLPQLYPYSLPGYVSMDLDRRLLSGSFTAEVSHHVTALFALSDWCLPSP